MAVKRLSTLPRLKLSVVFIPMRDQRESTLANAAAGADSEVLAGRLPKVLASRLRAARTAMGMSQAAVSKAMVDRGFSWRQTTVAKSEAGDRPVLFAEVAALAQIYRRPLDFFLYPGTELDSLLDQAVSEMESIAHALEQAQHHVVILQNDMRVYERSVGLVQSLVRYRNTSDGGVLFDDLRFLLLEHGRRVLEEDDIYESVGLTREQLLIIDREVLADLARAEQARLHQLSEDDLKDESPVRLRNISLLVEGGEAEPAFADYMRKTEAWPDFVGVQLADLVREAIDRQRIRPGG
ncbi:helix-turn-helix domain-containing protein [Streptomyces sp. NPDC054804]